MTTSPTQYQKIQGNGFIDSDLCYLELHKSYTCLFYNDDAYVANSLTKSGFSEILWNVLSTPIFSSHPLTTKLKSILAGKPFDLPHTITAIEENYEKLPGIRISETRQDHKRTIVILELSMWATIGQLKELSEEESDPWYIEVHTHVGRIAL